MNSKAENKKWVHGYAFSPITLQILKTAILKRFCLTGGITFNSKNASEIINLKSGKIFLTEKKKVPWYVYLMAWNLKG